MPTDKNQRPQLYEAPSDAIEISIKAEVQDEDEAEEAVERWLEQPENQEFGGRHRWTGKWRGEREVKESGIIAYFEKIDVGELEPAQEKKESPLIDTT